MQYDLWWKNAIMYCLDVETYLDSDGDGVGDFAGLQSRVPYLSDLGIDCIWLMPFYPSPNRDDGYDVSDYYGVDPRLGDLGDLTEFMRAARHHGLRLIADLVVNHTSTEHPWFQSAREGPDSPHHDYYVWQDERPDDWETSLVFPGKQIENWTYDRKAGRYYLHHFYEHQPDLNPNSPRVREEMKQILSFWTQLGVEGFRVDAVPFLIELGGIDAQLELTPHGLLQELSGYLRRRNGDAIMLGEVNLPPNDAREFFGNGSGDELQMIFNFHVNQYLHLALVRHHADPVRKALGNLPAIPEWCQWANFLTNHDELTLDQLTDTERAEVFEEFGPEEDMRLFGRGIRRRLPPMLRGSEERLRLAYSLLFSLPGAPVLFYGEEIGMGENLDIEGRRAVRSPMQWAPEQNGGFSSAPSDELTRPVTEGAFGPSEVNVASQSGRPGSMLEWMQRLIRCRRRAPEIGLGSYSLLEVDRPEVLALRFEWNGSTLISLHNFSENQAPCSIEEPLPEGEPAELWADRRYAQGAGPTFELGPFGYRWLRWSDAIGML